MAFFWMRPLPGRVVVAGAMFVVAGGRLGLYSYSSGAFVGDYTYGVAIILLALALLATGGPRLSKRWPGVLAAAVSAGVLAGMSIDIVLLAGMNNTSGMILLWLAVVLVFQAGSGSESQ